MMTARIQEFAVSLSFLVDGLVDNPPVPDLGITGVSTDSRRIQAGDLFIAYETASYSNIPYIADAVNAGASTVLVDEELLPGNFICSVPVIFIPELYKYVGIICARFYGQPSDQVNVIGVTGTNGKTSVSHIIARALSECSGKHAGLIGTLGTGLYEGLQPGWNTTPDAQNVQKLFFEMQMRGARHIVLEVSSHGIDQFRISGTRFKLAVFTNLSRDHLDYHGTMENYALSKQRLFTDYEVEHAVINLDDIFGIKMSRNIREVIPVTGYTLEEETYQSSAISENCVYGKIVSQSIQGMILQIHSPWGEGELHSSLFGEYNASNFLAACAALVLLGFDFPDVITALSGTCMIPGRMEVFGKENTCKVVIDYAHTPAALEKVLKTLRPLCNARLICVFGCGGDRDRGKRPEMAKIVEFIADAVIITNDNPRNEDPGLIIEEVLSGFASNDNVSVIPDREQAIREAFNSAGREDVVLLAGKGHEDYQEIAGKRIPFSDSNIVTRLLGEIS